MTAVLDHPGRVRIVVNELDGEARRGVLWGIRSRHYSDAPTARLAYEAEALTPRGTAAIATVTGASGGASNNVVRHANLSSAWTAVLSTDTAADGPLTHTGTYRVWARVASDAGADVQVRFAWEVGDLIRPEENAPKAVPGASPDPGSVYFYLLDLGEVRLDPSRSGSHRWRGEVLAKGAAGGEDVSIDKLWFQPVDDGCGKARTPYVPPYAPPRVAEDAFAATTAAAALNARTAPRGGAWATSGDATDFAFADDFSGEQVKRSASSSTNGRFAILGSAVYADMQVDATVTFSGNPSNGTEARLGVIARWTDSSNHLRGYLTRAQPSLGIFTMSMSLRSIVGGVDTFLGGASDLAVSANTPYILRLIAFSAGHCRLQLLTPNASNPEFPVVVSEVVAFSAALATGGALDDGKPGLYDYNSGAAAVTRWYDDFTVATPRPLDAVLHPSRSAELRHDGVVRENSDGSGWGPIVPEGDLTTLPPSGLEGRPVEVFLLASRGDLDQLPDAGIDGLSAQVFYRPSWLFTPDAS